MTEPLDRAPATPVNIRNFSVKCGACHQYQILCSFTREDDHNVYTYECENEICDPGLSRTLLEVPRELDEFANRDPSWEKRKHLAAEE